MTNDHDSKEPTVLFDEVVVEEQARISKQRANRQQDINSNKYSGLSISGGGIRSASFALGVMQALNSKAALRKIDYLSTVSGGGYIGSSWTWFNHLKQKGKIPDTGDDYFFPFGIKGQGARSHNTSIQSKILSYIRQHSSYLVPGFGLNYVSGFAVVLRNMILPILVYVSLLVAMFVGLLKLEILFNGMLDKDTINTASNSLMHSILVVKADVTQRDHLNLSMLMAFSAFGCAVLLGLIYGPVTFILSRTSELGYRIRTWFQIIMGSFIVASFVFGFLGLLPIFVRELIHVGSTTTGGVFGVIGSLWHFFRQNQNTASGLSSKVIAILSSLLIIIAIASASYYLASHYFPNAWMVALPIGLAFGYFVNINQFGLGKFYRDRLIETFMPNIETVEADLWQPATEAATTEIVDVSTDVDQGPYHLLNTNLILVDSKNKKFKGRGGDNFILSSLFCGSDATGWTHASRFNNKDLTLATAMATSGAAVNPHAGPDSQGITRNPLVSFLMFILGLRMGLYVINPRKANISGLNNPNYLAPGIKQGLVGVGFNSRSRHLALSDGGHFENTATYELIRRQLDVIVVSEAGQDEDFSFEDISNLIEKVRVDFGVQITFKKDYDIQYLVPGSADDETSFAQRYGMAKRGFAIAEIHYPQVEGQPKKTPGLLFIVKATMTSELPADLYGYKDANPTFPNQTTMDQFFDEVQFESYRELGYQLAKKMTANEHFLAAFNTNQ